MDADNLAILFDNKKVEAVRLAIDHVQMAATQFEAFALATLTDFWVGKEAAELSVMLHRHLQSSRVAHEFARLDTDEMVALFAAIMVPGRRGSKLEHKVPFLLNYSKQFTKVIKGLRDRASNLRAQHVKRYQDSSILLAEFDEETGHYVSVRHGASPRRRPTAAPSSKQAGKKAATRRGRRSTESDEDEDDEDVDYEACDVAEEDDTASSATMSEAEEGQEEGQEQPEEPVPQVQVLDVARDEDDSVSSPRSEVVVFTRDEDYDQLCDQHDRQLYLPALNFEDAFHNFSTGLNNDLFADDFAALPAY